VFRTRVKICGITRRKDAEGAIAAGADAIGLVFYAPSPRAVDIHSARDILAGLPPLVSSVGLFVDPQREEVEEACATLPLSLLQFHGDEPPAFCESFGLPWMKAVRVSPETDIVAAMAPYKTASAILLDTFSIGVPGGTGQRFDWTRVPARRDRPLVLAGGLDPRNVAAAIGATRPYAVDVSGGVEEAPGCKSLDKVREFIAAVRAADLSAGEPGQDQQQDRALSGNEV
jgi:phosphoribosylanthranilate isomerase